MRRDLEWMLIVEVVKVMCARSLTFTHARILVKLAWLVLWILVV